MYAFLWRGWRGGVQPGGPEFLLQEITGSFSDEQFDVARTRNCAECARLGRGNEVARTPPISYYKVQVYL